MESANFFEVFFDAKISQVFIKKEPGHLNIKIPSEELKGFCLSSKE